MMIFIKNHHQDQLLDCKLGRGRQLNEKEQIKLQVGDCDGIDHEYEAEGDPGQDSHNDEQVLSFEW